MPSRRRSYGTGSLYESKDGRTWVGHWRVSGRQIKRTLGPKRAEGTRDGLTKTQAEAKLRQLMSELKPAGPVGQRITVEVAGERYRQHLTRAGRKRSTITAVESALRVHLVPFFTDKSLDAIRHEDVLDLIALMERKQVGPKSIRNYIGTLSALFNYAMGPQRRWATANPCRGVELPAVPRADEIKFLELVEIDALVASARPGAYQAIDRALYRTAAMTGLREGELIALRWRDVDWTAAKIRVRQNYVLGEFDTPKSKRSTRSVLMADEAAAELDGLFKTTHAQDDDDLVFTDPRDGGPLDKAGILRRLRKALKAARLDTSHTFHHCGGRADANPAGVDGAPRHRNDAAVRGLCAERARGRHDRRGVRAE